eukprot:7289642-Pyramimonas_sp.AAC.1
MHITCNCVTTNSVKCPPRHSSESREGYGYTLATWHLQRLVVDRPDWSLTVTLVTAGSPHRKACANDQIVQRAWP